MHKFSNARKGQSTNYNQVQNLALALTTYDQLSSKIDNYNHFTYSI